MTNPTRKIFLDRFPEFGEQAGKVIDAAIASATLSTPESVWGFESPYHTSAVCYLTAHLLASRTIQIGLQVNAPSGQPLSAPNTRPAIGATSTLYGQEYERMKATLPVTGFIV
jgi:hypothetical protein